LLNIDQLCRYTSRTVKPSLSAPRRMCSERALAESIVAEVTAA